MQRKNNVNRTVGHILTTEKTYYGYTTSEIFGVLLMIVPFIIGMTFSKTNYWFEALFGKLFVKTTVDIRPENISITLSILMYIGLALRFNIFKTNNLLNGIISSIRMFLNCSVMAMIIRIVYPISKKGIVVPFHTAITSNWEIMVLVMAVVLTWAGVRTLAGYSWGICILVSLSHQSKISEYMGSTGYIFMILAAISMLLQIKDWNNVRNFVNEFFGSTQSFRNDIRKNIGVAADDATYRVNTAAQYVKTVATGDVTNVIMKKPRQRTSNKDD